MMKKLRNLENLNDSNKHDVHPGSTLNPIVRLDSKEKLVYASLFY